MNREAFIHGLYPRSAELIAVTQGLDKGRFTSEDLTRLQASDIQKSISLQKEQGFAYVEVSSTPFMKTSFYDFFRNCLA